MRRDVFQAIADPTRREIIGVIARKAMTLNSVAETFDISRQAVSKHIQILCECGLVVIEQQGRERICRAKLDKLDDVAGWVEQYRKLWATRFDAFDELLFTMQAKNKKSVRKK